MITNSSYNAHTNVLFFRLNLYDNYKLQLVTFMYKYFNHYLPDHVDDYFILNSYI